MTRDVSVVICAYTEKRWQDLACAVTSVHEQTHPAHEVIVVVDHNTQMAARARGELPGVTVVENSQPRGLSGARNSGIAVATGSIIAFLDDDSVADSLWLARLGSLFDDPDVVGGGGTIAPMWQTGKPFWFPEEFRWVVGCTYRGMPESVAPVRNLIGCNMALRRDVFDDVGGFSHGIGRVGTRPVGCEETELCIRVRQARPRSIMLYDPASVVHHRIPANRARLGYFVARCYAEGLSKALVAQLVGSKDGLSSERTYTFKTLPRGIAGGITEAFRGRPAGLTRAAAIAVGLMVTTAGYLIGQMSERAIVEPVQLEVAA